MCQIVKTAVVTDFGYRQVGIQQQTDGLLNPVVQEIAVQRHAGVLQKQTVYIIWMVSKSLADLPVGQWPAVILPYECKHLANLVGCLSPIICRDVRQNICQQPAAAQFKKPPLL